MAHRADGLSDIFENNVIIRKALMTDSGTIQQIPVANLDITNKAYVDGVAPAALTNDSMADALHRHSELSASDGTPNPAVYMHTDGVMHFPATVGAKIQFYNNYHYEIGIQSAIMQFIVDGATGGYRFGYGTSESLSRIMDILADGKIVQQSALGDRIDCGYNYGIGIQPATLQLYTASALGLIKFGYGTSASFTRAMTIDMDVGVGILRDPATYPLEVNGIVYSTSGVRAPWIGTGDSSYNKCVLSMTSGGTYYGKIQVENTGGAAGGAWSLGYGAGNDYVIGTPVLSWTGGGKVGIGNINPTYLLDVRDAVNNAQVRIEATADTKDAELKFGTSTYAMTQYLDDTDGTLNWYAGGNQLTLDQSGNLTAATSVKSPSYKSGAETGQTTTATIVTDLRNSSGQLQKRIQLLTFTAGLLTAKGAESDWTDTTDV